METSRALGRNVEDAMLVETELRARRDGVRRLVGQFVATAKNGIVETFYADHGFAPAGTDGLFERDLAATAPLQRARHITLIVEEGEQ